MRLPNLLAGFALLFTTAWAQTTALSFKPIDARYSKQLDRIIAVSTSPHALHIYDAATSQDTIVALPLAPKSVSVGPSGLYAAVAHTGKISYVNLVLGRIERELNVNGEIYSIVLASQFVHVLPSVSINLTTGAQSGTNHSYYPASGGALHPSGSRLYSTRDGITPNDIHRFDVSTGPITGETDSRYHGDYSVCGEVWISDDGQRIFNSCGTFFRYDSVTENDLRYGGTLEGTTNVTWLGLSPAAGRVAAIPREPYYTPPGEEPATDSEVRFFDPDYLRHLGTAALPDFETAGKKYKAHGKWLFYNGAGTALYVLMQADSTSGLINDFAIHKIASAAPAGCTFQFETASTAAPSFGGPASINLTAPSHCVYQATTQQSWIRLSVGGYSAGSGRVSYSLSANTSGAAREGAIKIGDQTFTISQPTSAVGSANPMYRVGFRPVDSRYSKAVQKLVFASAYPHELHIFDPATRTDRIVSLDLLPTSVSVAPSAPYAAVGHYGWVSYVNLNTGAIEKRFPLALNVNDLVLAGNGYIYVFDKNDWGELFSVHVATGAQTSSMWIYNGMTGLLHPSGKYIYTESGSVIDITEGAPKQAQTGYSSDFCRQVWLTEGGDGLISRCGIVYRVASSLTEWEYQGKFTPESIVAATAHSSTQGLIAVVPADDYPYTGTNETRIKLFGDEYLSLQSQLTFPTFPGGTKAARGRDVFWSADSQSLYAVLQADTSEELTADYAIWTASPALPNPGCVVGLAPSSGSAPGTGGTAQISVTSGPSCVWKAVSSASWLTVQGGSFGVDAATIRYTAQPNFTTAARTATITIGGSSFTLTQAPGSPDLCVYTLSSTTVATPSTGLAVQASITVQGTNCTWSASSNAPWAQVFPLSGTGSKTLYLTIFPNFTTKSRTAAITVAGQAISLSQAGNAASAGERFVRLLYFNHFGRQPSSEEVNGHISSGLPRGRLAINFMSSLEFATGGRYVAGLYKGILSRDPEFSGWLFQRNAMVTGAIAPLTLVSSFLGSEEFRVKYGSPSNAEFVRILYRNILLREPSQQEVDFQAGALAGLSRSQLTSNLLNSTEFRNGVGPRLTAFLLYSVLMSRGGSQSELGSVETQLKGSTSLRTLVDSMLNSPEFSSLLQ